MKTIRSKIMLCMTLTLVIALLTVGVITAVENYTSTLSTLEQTMTVTAKVVSDRLEHELNGYLNLCCEIGSISEFSNPALTAEEKQAILQKRVEYFGFAQSNLLDSEGRSVFDGTDFSDREYYKEALRGRAVISEPLVSRVTGELSIIIAAPVWEGGDPGGKVAGVVYIAPSERFLSDTMASIKVGENGTAFMIDEDGLTIADTNLENVKRGENTIAEAKTDPSLQALAELEQHMIAGENGYGTYRYNGMHKLLAYCPLSMNGWSVAVCAPLKDFLASTYTGIILTLCAVLLFSLITVLVAWRLSSGIGKPIAACAERLRLLSQGDLASAAPESHAKDETGILTTSTRDLKESLGAMIGDMDHLLDRMSNCDFTVDTDCPEAYVGEFRGLLDAVQLLKKHLTGTLLEIDASADQVATGADQVSSGAQALAQGSTEQAASVEELAATVNEISGNVHNAARNAKTAEDENLHTHEEIKICNNQMQELVAAIGVINGKSDEIGKIIKTIEDIAFQTNILALNAAVEAARAGSAGKGFAVVADEVRNLAGKSQEAAQSTTVLIQDTLHAVEQGTSLSNQTEESLQRVVKSAEAVLKAVTQISNASADQANAVSQISVGVDQISTVVQSNSATSEESAAASIELSRQARHLKDLVGQFRLPAQKG